MSDETPMELHLPTIPGLPADAPVQMHQALVEQLPAVLYINAPDEIPTTWYVSPQTTRILGVAEEEWFADTWGTHVHPDDRDRVDRDYLEVLAHGSESVDEYRFIRPDGKVIWIHDRVSVIRDGDGQPLVVQGVMFDITERREAEVALRREARLLERVDVITRRFHDLLLGGTQIGPVLDTLADIVRNPVLLEDSAHLLVQVAAHGTELAELLERWSAHCRSPHEAPGTLQVGCVWIPVRLRGEEWGRLHVLQLESPLDELDRLALDRAGDAVGLALLSMHHGSAMVEAARSELVADVWRGRWHSGSEVVARAATLDARLPGTKLAALVVEVDDGSDTSAASIPWARQQALHDVLEACEAAITAVGAEGLSAVVGDICMAIIGTDERLPSRELVEELGGELVAALAEQMPGWRVAVGLSRPAAPPDLRRALDEARQGASHGIRVERRSGTYHVDDLALRQLLSRLGEGPELARFVEVELGPLLTQTAAHAELLRTLRTYLECGRHKTRTAAALHVERRTLYHRMDRLAALLGADLEDTSVLLRLEVALQGWDVLRQRGTAATPSR